MATLLTNFVVPAASSQYVSLYVGNIASPQHGELKLLIDVFTSGTIGSVTLQNGYGGPSDPAIIWPWVQPIPLAIGLNTFPVTKTWSLNTTSYSPTALSGGRQQVEVIVDLTQTGDWLNIVIPANVAQPATVNIYGA